MPESGRCITGENCLVIMAKYPEPGRVKSRLAADIGNVQACELYAYFVLDLLESLSGVAWSLRLALYPPEKKEEMAKLIGSEVAQMPQRGGDLGERMTSAFFDLFLEGFQKVVLIGSDTPDLPGDFISEAFDALTEYDAVIGPACDGGYYLIGFRRTGFKEEIFTHISWSTSDTFSKQLRRFQETNIQVYILPSWRDADTLTDLKNLAAVSGMTSFADSRTMRYLQTTGLL
jgi:uncharacterized protein